MTDFLRGYANSSDEIIVLLTINCAARVVESVLHPVTARDKKLAIQISALRWITHKRGLELPRELARAAMKHKAHRGVKREYWKIIYGALDTLVRDERKD